MSENIESRLIAILSTLSDVDADRIKSDTKLEALNFDSLVLLELSLKLRKEFGVDEVDEELDLVETVDELVELVKKRQVS